MLICEFTIDDPETRAANASDAQAKLAALDSGEWDGSEETPQDEEVVESPDILGGLLDTINDVNERLEREGARTFDIED